MAAVVLWATADAPDPSVSALARANPGLKVAADIGGRVLVSYRDDTNPVFMRASDAGPYAVHLVPCTEVVASLPTWFRLTDDAATTGCLEIASDDGPVQVLNFQTAGGIPALWDEFYEPRASAAGLGFHGGSASGAGVETRQAPRSLAYSVDGSDGADSALSIDAFLRGNLTLAAVTLRLGRP